MVYLILVALTSRPKRRPADARRLAIAYEAAGRYGIYRAGRYWAVTAGAFLRAATHWLPLSRGVVLAARTAPPAAIATAPAAIETSSGASTMTETSYSPKDKPPASIRAP